MGTRTRTTKKDRKEAIQFLARIDTNTNEYHVELIDYKKFSTKNRSIWNEIEKASPSVKECVLEGLRIRDY